MSWVKEKCVYLTFDIALYNDIDESLISSNDLVMRILDEYAVATSAANVPEIYWWDLIYRMNLMPVHTRLFIERKMYDILYSKMVSDRIVDNNISLLEYLRQNHFGYIRPFWIYPAFCT